MPALADLIINLSAETASLTRGLEKATNDVNKFARNIEKSMDSLKAVGATLLVSLGLDKLGDALTSTIERMTAMEKKSQQLGVSTQVLGGLEYAARLTNTSTEALDNGLAKLAKTALTTAEKGDKATGAFKMLGIQVTDNQGRLRSSDQLFLDIADKFSKMEDGSTKTALAMQFFGRAGAELIAVLNLGSTGLAGMSEEAIKLGIAFGPEAAAMAHEAEQNFLRMELALTGLKNQAVLPLLPVVAELAKEMVELNKDGALTAFAENSAGALRRLVVVFDALITGSRELALRLEDIAQLGGAVAAGASGNGAAFAQYLIDRKEREKQYQSLDDQFTGRAVRMLDPAPTIPKPRTGATPKVPDLTKTQEAMAQALAFFAQLQEKLAKANDDVIGEINARWGVELAKAAEQYRKFPELKSQYLDAELQITLTKRREIAEAEQKLLMDANKAVADLVKNGEAGVIASLNLGSGKDHGAVLKFDPLGAQSDDLARDPVARAKALDESFLSTRTHAELLAAKLRDIKTTYTGADGLIVDQNAYERALAQANNTLNDSHMAWMNFAEGAGKDLQSLVMHTESWQQAFTNILEMLPELIAKLLFMSQIQDMMDAGGGTGFFGGLLGGLLGIPHRALGGPVSGGEIYQVNENMGGSQYWMAPADGYIYPNSASAMSRGGGGGGPIINVDLRGVDAATVPFVNQRVREGVEQAIRASQAKMYDRSRRS